jgi:RND family efflux transporter MFP subunit
VKTLAKIVLPFVLIAIAALVVIALVQTKPKPADASTEGRVEPVEVMAVSSTETQAVLTGNGTVTPSEQLNIIPQVSGVIVETHPNLVPGGTVRKGELLVRIDPSDYRLAVQQRRAQVDASQFEIKLERGRRVVAEREWELLEKDIPVSELGKELALRKPNQRIAKSNLSAASAGLQTARNNLDRTTIRAPFDGVIRSESVEVGQVVNPGAPIITLLGTTTAWVEVSVPADRLRYLQIPGLRGVPEDAQGAPATLTGAAGTTRRGHAVRLLGELDPRTRMASVVVSFSDPLGLNAEPSVEPILFGTYVLVHLEGRSLGKVFHVPLHTVTPEGTIWLHESGALKSKAVKVVWKDETNAYVEGLAEGDDVVVSRMAAPVLNMPIMANTTGAPATKASAQ